MAIKQIKTGEAITAKWLNLIVDLVNRNNLAVAQGSGLTLTKTDSGAVLGTTRQPGTPYVWAKVTTAIPTGDESSPSTSGEIAFAHWDSDAGVWSIDTDDTARCCNSIPLSADMPADSLVQVFEFEGDWWLAQGPCPTGG